jgi:uncharacterized integral membrane protein
MNGLFDILNGDKPVPSVPVVVDLNMKNVFIAIGGILAAGVILVLVMQATKK